jgi:hypothetical protein
MTGTSKALSRLGVTGLGAVLAFAGLVPLTAVSANAAQATTVTLSPDSDTAAVGTCNPFTATVAPAGSEITVNIQQAVPTNADAGAVDIGFCNPSGTSTEGNGIGGTTAGAGTAANNTTAASPSASQCTNTAGNGTGAGADDTKSKNVSCNQDFDDTDNDGSITFGVTSNTAGSMTVNAFGDTQTVNGAQDANESGETSTKTWVANDQSNVNNKIDCEPETAQRPAGGDFDFTCEVTDANGNALAGVTNIEWAVASGPDAGDTGTCSTTDDGSGGTTAGEAFCTVSNSGTPGHDVIDVWLEQNGTPGRQGTEPTDQITVDWLLAAPDTSELNMTCSPNSFAEPDYDPSDCQASVADGDSFTFTATVTNGNPAQPVSGVIVEWSFHEDGTDTDGDEETLSADQCTTNAQGSCSVSLNNPTPTDGEDFHVFADAPTQGGGSTGDSSHALVVEPQKYDARNISVEPSTANQVSGGAQSFVATVTDRFGNPVEGVLVTWDEDGPGAFRGSNDCTTDEDGQCDIEVESLATETGNETVTATLDDSNYTALNQNECEAPAGRTFVFGGTSATTPPGDQAETGSAAPAGNCSDSGVVTWSKETTQPPKKTKIAALINCFSPRKHVLKCKVKEAPAIAGLTVVFKRKIHGDVKKIGVRTTNSNGVAKLKKRHLKSGKLWRVFAHVRSTSTTTGATTGTDRTRIK